MVLILHLRDHSSRDKHAGHLLLVTNGGIFKQHFQNLSSALPASKNKEGLRSPSHAQ